MQERDCPTPKELRSFVLGYDDHSRAEALESHLLQCDACARRADEAIRQDRWVQTIRATKLPHALSEELHAVCDRWHVVGGSANTVQDLVSQATAVRPEFSLANHAADVARCVDMCMEPPKGPDELGRLGPYRILRFIGSGGMGMVFLGEDIHLNRLAAIKVLRPSLANDASVASRFSRESQLAAKLSDERIVRIYQAGSERGTPFLAMEFLDGPTLASLQQTVPQWSAEQIIDIGTQLAQGLDAAHRHGVVHRDIKPENIVLQPSAHHVSGYALKILDFGIARFAERSVGDEGPGTSMTVTSEGHIVGTVGYLAPELIRGETATPASDLFALGCVLYRLATGSNPYRNDNLYDYCRALATESPRSACSVNTRIPRSVSHVIDQLIEQEPSARPPSARDVIDRLSAASNDDRGTESRADQPPHQRNDGTSRSSNRSGSPAGIDFRRSLMVLMSGFALATILYWWTASGVVRVTIFDPKVQVTLVGERLTIRGVGSESVRLKTGPHGLEVRHGDLQLVTHYFELKRGAEVAVSVQRTDADQVKVLIDDKEVGRYAVDPAKPLEVEATPEAVVEGVKPESEVNDGNFAIRLQNAESITGPLLDLAWDGELTVEFQMIVSDSPYIRDETVEDGEIVHVPGLFDFCIRDRHVEFYSFHYVLRSSERVETNQRIHVAGVRTAKERRLYLNGQLSAVHVHPLEVPEERTEPVLTIGRNYAPVIIDEFRVSRVARYQQAFTPRARWEVDEHTELLYHFDEGQGKTIHDASPHARHLTTLNPNWCRLAVGDRDGF